MFNNTVGFQNPPPKHLRQSDHHFTFFDKTNQSISTLLNSKFKNQISIRSLKFNNHNHNKQNSEDFYNLSHKDDKQDEKTVSLYLHKIDKRRNDLPSLANRSMMKTTGNVRYDNVADTIYSQVPFRSAYQPNQDKMFENLMNIQNEVRNTHTNNYSPDHSKTQKFNKSQFSLYNDVPVMSELNILKEYRFRLPVLMDSIEGPNNFIHINEGFHQSYNFLESMLNDLKIQLQTVKSEKDSIKQSLLAIKQQYPDEINAVEQEFNQKFPRFDIILKQNFVQEQNQNFNYQKLITQMKKDNLLFQDDIEKLLLKLRIQEKQLYGVELFELQTDDQQLNQIQKMNLRQDVMKMNKQEKQKLFQYIIH